MSAEWDLHLECEVAKFVVKLVVTLGGEAVAASAVKMAHWLVGQKGPLLDATKVGLKVVWSDAPMAAMKAALMVGVKVN